MQTTAEARENLVKDIAKLKKNKELVPPDQLAGKYKKPYEALKAQIKQEGDAFLTPILTDGLRIRGDDEGMQLISEIQNFLKSSEVGRQTGHAIYKNFDLEEAVRITEETRSRIISEFYQPYLDRHTCLRASAECFAEENPKTPRIYNDILDLYLDNGAWAEDREESGKPAILIFIKDKEKEEAET